MRLICWLGEKMSLDVMSHRVVVLAQELVQLTTNPPERPTEADRENLMNLRYRIRDLRSEESVTEAEENVLCGMYVMATKEANRQEDFYEKNNNKWADE